MTGERDFLVGKRVTVIGLGIEGVDAAPTQPGASAVPDVIKDSRTLQADWETIKSQEIPALNQQLRAAGLPAIEIAR